jgi:Ca2+-binding EF-hand superfamily protein
VIGIASEESALAPVIGILLCLGFLHIFCQRPFKEEEDSSLGILLTYSLTFIFMSALLIKVDQQPDGPLERRLFGFVLVFLLMMGPGVIIMNLLTSVLSNFFERRKEKKKKKVQAVLDDGVMLRRPTRGTSLIKGRGNSYRRGPSVRMRSTSFTDGDENGLSWQHQSNPPKRTAPPSLAELFALIDLNGDGELSKDEVVAAAGLLNMTPEEAGRLFDSLDVDGSGTLSKEEFSAASLAKTLSTGLGQVAESLVSFMNRPVTTSENSSKREALAALFEIIDLDGDGQLTKSEVVQAAGLLGLTDNQAARLFDEMDDDGSGTLTQEEFGASKFSANITTGLKTVAGNMINLFAYAERAETAC